MIHILARRNPISVSTLSGRYSYFLTRPNILVLTFDARVGVVVRHPVLPAAARAAALQPGACALQLVFAFLAQQRVTDTPNDK
jgi:hypothetical protein